MQPNNSKTEQRRQFLLNALSTGALVGGLGWQSEVVAGWFGRRPRKLPADQSIYELEGKVLINGRSATKSSLIRANDRIETAPGGKIVYAVGNNAYILRERSILEMQGKDLLTQGLRLVSGAMLGVFGKRQSALVLRSRSATIGIRGTALYNEIFDDRTYLCTCYGQTRIQALNNPEQREDVFSQHHDAPRWIKQSASNGENLIQAAPMINHSDMELVMLEALVGREVPFATPLEPVDGMPSAY
ncbi:MAG: hypothetical protein ACSHXK_02270 [Oceanococcus sp.]